MVWVSRITLFFIIPCFRHLLLNPYGKSLLCFEKTPCWSIMPVPIRMIQNADNRKHESKDILVCFVSNDIVQNQALEVRSFHCKSPGMSSKSIPRNLRFDCLHYFCFAPLSPQESKIRPSNHSHFTKSELSWKSR